MKRDGQGKCHYVEGGERTGHQEEGNREVAGSAERTSMLGVGEGMRACSGGRERAGEKGRGAGKSSKAKMFGKS